MTTDDAESYIRTDDESLMGTDNEEGIYIRSDDSYLRTDEEDAELYDKDPKVSTLGRCTKHK